MKKFEVGQRVACGVDEGQEFTGKIIFSGEYDEGPAFGKVTDVLANGDVMVLWDDEYHNETVYSPKTGKPTGQSPIKMKSGMLMLEDDAKAKVSDLEKEYKVVVKEVKEKLKTAGQCLREANKLAKKVGSNLHDMYDATDPLLNAMDACGWRTSSFDC